jgi:hypothetical protein
MILSQSEWNFVATSMASTTNLSTQQKEVDKVVEEYKDMFSSPTWVPLHFQVENSIDLTHGTFLRNGLVYYRSLLENEEIKHQIQELLQKGHVQPNSLLK